MSAVAGTFVKFDAVPTRKVVRITIEAPIEKADEILRQLGGYPDPSNANWVGIAPLVGEPKEYAMKGGGLAANAAMLCDSADFEFYAKTCGQASPRELILQQCGISSRAHLDHDDEAASRFRRLKEQFEAWRSGRKGNAA